MKAKSTYNKRFMNISERYFPKYQSKHLWFWAQSAIIWNKVVH